jgi:hypothetical protein
MKSNTKSYKILLEVKTILNDLQEYWPLTLRQIFYQLVSKGIIENTTSRYTMLSNLLKNARLENEIPWETMEDRGRIFEDHTGFIDKSSFINNELHWFLNGYKKNLLSDQDRAIEIWIEKDALRTVFNKVAEKFSIPVVVCRGFSSISFIKNYVDRIEKQSNYFPTILYYGDLDPSGWQMPIALKETLQNNFYHAPEIYRGALNEDQVKKYNLPNDPDALKSTDTRAKNYVKQFGNLAVELDALHPQDLTEIVQNDIISFIDVDRYDDKVREYNLEIDQVKALKDKAKVKVQELLEAI